MFLHFFFFLSIKFDNFKQSLNKTFFFVFHYTLAKIESNVSILL